MRVMPLVIALLAAGAMACSSNQGQAEVSSTTPTPAQPQTPVADIDTPDQAAARGLTTLRKLATEETYEDLGFESLSEVERGSLAPSFRVFFVRLDSLRDFSQSDDARRLLIDAKRYVYPVMVEGNPRSAITVELLNNRWEAVGFGGGGLIAEYAKLRMMKTGEKSEEFVAVQVPAMQLNFLGQGVGGSELLLTPLPSNADADRTSAMFRKNKAIVGVKAQGNDEVRPADLEISSQYRTSTLERKAGDIFKILAPEAKKIRDDVPR
jgi:hypothetical protein